MNTLKKEQFLNGVRIVDFTMNLAGPYATYLLGMLGAEVIRIEHSKRLDVLRRRSKNDFNAVNLNKKSITIDLKNEKGLEIAKKLISKSDVFVESFRPGIVDKLGLGYDELKRIKKNIVMLSLSGFGSTGPERNYASWASIFAAMSGVSYGTGYSDSIPTEFRGTYDTRVGQMVAFAVMTGIIYRQKTGKGQYIDLSAIESQICTIGEFILDYVFNERITERIGNSDNVMAPHNTYKCKGDDCWVSIAVSDDIEWKNMCMTIGKPELIEDKKFSDPISRWKNQKDLDNIINSWTINYTDYEVTEMLQNKNVASMPVLSAPQIFSDAHLSYRRFIDKVDHPEIGERLIFGPPWSINNRADYTPKCAPLLGEHNDYVMLNILGLTTDEVSELKNKNILY